VALANGNSGRLATRLLQIGRQPLHTLLLSRGGDFYHLGEQPLGGRRLLPAQVTLSNLGTHELARPAVSEPLRRGLMRFDLWHFQPPLSQTICRVAAAGARQNIAGVVLAPAARLAAQSQSALAALPQGLLRAQDHKQASAFGMRPLLYHRHIFQLRGHPIQEDFSQL
jgi:hypothetical protein